MTLPTEAQFAKALKQGPKPRGRQLDFLREHVRAPGRALTARCLAQSVGYQNHGGKTLVRQALDQHYMAQRARRPQGD